MFLNSLNWERYAPPPGAVSSIQRCLVDEQLGIANP